MVFIGCAGWSLPRRFQSEFPEGGSHLERYSQVFSCTEINSSFYRSHQSTTWRRWADSVPTHFRFSVKASRSITHDYGMQGPEQLVSTFIREVNQLGEKLGTILFQTPPKLEFNQQVVGRFFTYLRSIHNGSVAIEPRHASWFSKSADRLLRVFQVVRVAADPVVDPEGAHPGGSSSFVYYRLHGSPRKYYSAYSKDRLTELANVLRDEAEAPAWCIFDNTASGSATQDALYLQQIMSQG